jgi:glycosyltransferase involved in cell wall biosynthesis
VAHGFWAFPSGFLAVLIGKIFYIKSIITLQGGDAISLPEIKYGQLQRWLPRTLILWAIQHADELISPTRYMIDNLRTYGLTRSEVRYIPLGIDLSLFTFREKKIEPTVRFLHIGNFNRVKDQVTLLKAFQIISKNISSQLTILGEGELEQEIKSLACELELNEKIVFHPTVPYESLPMLYHRSDILLHTSLSEGHPIVVEEAMGCGVLVCGTKVGLLYDHPACCVAVPVKDFEMLGYEVLKLLRDEQRIKLMRQEAYSWASSHPIAWSVQKLKGLYIGNYYA